MPMYGLTWENGKRALTTGVAESPDVVKGLSQLLFYQTVIVLIYWCHMTAMWSDPGLVARDASGIFREHFQAELERAQATNDPAQVKRVKRAYCLKCNIPKPKGAHHCSLCGRCVRRMDHHCPWINNCAAERTIKPFVLFLAYVCLGTTYSMGMMLYRAYEIATNPKLARRSPIARDAPLAEQPVAQLALSVIAFVIALFFDIFVIMMMVDQYEAATTDTPGIDAMQGIYALPEDVRRGVIDGFRRNAFHERLSWRWFVPLPPPITRPPPPSGPPPGPHDAVFSSSTAAEAEAETPLVAAAEAPQADVANANAEAEADSPTKKLD